MLRFRFLSSTFLRAPEGEGAPGGEAAPDTSAFTDVLNAGTVIAPPAGDGSDGGEGGEPGTGASAQPGEVVPPPDPPPAPTPPPDGQADKAGADDPLVALRQQVQDFLAKAPAPQEAPKPTPPAEPAKTPEPAKQPGEAPKYDLEVPDAIVEAFESDDRATRKSAIKALVNGIANKLAQDFGSALQDLVKHVESKVPQEVLSQVDTRNQLERIQSDFYQHWPELARVAKSMPGLEESMWTQIRDIGQRMQLKEWTPEFRDGVGRMLHLNLGIPVAQAPPAAEAPKPTPPRKPAFSAGSSGGGRPNGSGPANEFQEVLDAGHW
jgi:hypothetical protein